MPPEALEEAQDWLVRAERDLLMAWRALEGNPMLADQAAFHAQQAAEKALKAFLAASEHEIPRTHNLELLVGLCQIMDAEFVRFRDTAQTLNPYATQFRYPGGALEPSPDEAQEAINLAAETVSFIRNRISP
jgi:HEPN domain-containing protein